MTRFVLRDSGYPTFKKIMSGRKWIGRVGKCADGDARGYFGKIGSTFVYAPTELEAFDLVVARHCGFETVDGLQANNRMVRNVNRANRARAAAEFEEFLGPELSGLIRQLGR